MARSFCAPYPNANWWRGNKSSFLRQSRNFSKSEGRGKSAKNEEWRSRKERVTPKREEGRGKREEIKGPWPGALHSSQFRTVTQFDHFIEDFLHFSDLERFGHNYVNPLFSGFILIQCNSPSCH